MFVGSSQEDNVVSNDVPSKMDNVLRGYKLLLYGVVEGNTIGVQSDNSASWLNQQYFKTEKLVGEDSFIGQ